DFARDNRVSISLVPVDAQVRTLSAYAARFLDVHSCEWQIVAAFKKRFRPSFDARAERDFMGARLAAGHIQVFRTASSEGSTYFLSPHTSRLRHSPAPAPP